MEAPAQLMADAKCFASCAANVFSAKVIECVLLKQILLLLNPNATVDPAALLAQGTCFICSAPNLFSLGVMEAVLLGQIQSAGGPSSNACILGGIGAPTVAVPCAFSVYVQQPGPNFGLWIGDQSTGVWGNIIAQGP